MAQALDRIATAVANEGDYPGSWELYERSLALWRDLGDERGLAVSTTNVGCLALMEGDLERAVVLSREARVLYERTGQRELMLHPMLNLGAAELLQGRHADALATLREALAHGLEVGYLESVPYVLEGLAAVHAAIGEAERAASLLGTAAAVAEESGVALEPFEQELHDRTVETARSALGDAAFAAAVAAGRERPPSDGLA
jgi:tetratricopeptide (TPR) repeat protein